MDTTPACCEPCETLQLCAPERNCCLECHFAYEEVLAMPFLPPHLQQRLRREHAWLEANHFPKQAVAAHAAWEEAVFRQYCPWVSDIVERDHVAHGDGALVSRVQFPTRRDGAMFSPRWATATMG